MAKKYKVIVKFFCGSQKQMYFLNYKWKKKHKLYLLDIYILQKIFI